MSAIERLVKMCKELSMAERIMAFGHEWPTLPDAAAAELAALRNKEENFDLISAELHRQEQENLRLRAENERLRQEYDIEIKMYNSLAKRNDELRAELDVKTKAVEEARAIINRAIRYNRQSLEEDAGAWSLGSTFDEELSAWLTEYGGDHAE
jgi:hypothetical protein